MRRGSRTRRGLLVLALLAAAAPVAGQQRPPAQRPATPADTLTAEQRALQRLRDMRGVAQPDTVTEPTDSIEPQTVSVTAPGGTRAAAPPPSQIERDSIMNVLLGIDGYIGTEYSADRAQYFADSARLELRGSPKVAREGNQLVADSSIIYSQERSFACGYGNPVLHAADQSEPLVSDTVCFDVERQIGRAPGASTRVQEGATWNVRCDAYFSGDELYCHDALFTDCDEPFPHQHYAFHAAELKAVRGNVVVGRNVTMRFADVPVFWLPFFMQSLSRGRRSGILMPRFGINDIARNSSNYNRRIEDVGFYLAINDYMGAELAMDWHANNWTALRGSFDYNWTRRFLRGGVTLRRFWRDGGSRVLTLASNNSWKPDERTTISLNADYASSSEFVEQQTFDPRELNRSVDSNGSIQRQFDWGSASLGISRKQHLADNTVQAQLPSFRLSVSPLTLFEAAPGEEEWYSNLTWSGSGDLRIDTRDIDPANATVTAQSTRDLSSSVRSRLNIGRLSSSQSITFNEQSAEERIAPGDVPVHIPGSAEQSGRWSTNLSYEQRVIGTSTITPTVSFSGQYLRNDSTGQALVMSPTRIDFSSSLRLEMFGFWPGFGPFERLRHRVTPSFSYGYSPAARADSLQRAIFGDGVAEQNRITIGLSQTFEAKYRSDVDDEEGDAPGDGPAPGDTTGAAEDSARAQQAARRTPGLGDTLGGVVLTRREQVATISLLEISTEALVYDFVRARDDHGLVNTQVRNTLRSDLLRGLQMSVTHDLFRESRDSLGEVSRSFAPHLRDVNASFSINGNSWIFRVLGLGSGEAVPTETGGVPLEPGDPNAAGPAVDRTEPEYGMIGTSRRTAEGAPRGAVGAWNASINYSLLRPREATSSSRENQMVRGNVTFQPTENWTLRWTTGYSITTSQFSDHVLTLTRTLHDWDANFDFVKAQNGNFSFQFRVHLRANPDVKLDYHQSDVRALQTAQ
ncbi:MAG TPA: putative LPS assembly protein LptD [Longimicrobiales bacterium]|nr:putative LPS assembly protein LptD [Longimicrobiales bacterium]